MVRHLLDEADRCRATQDARRDAAAEWGMSWLERRVHDDLAPTARSTSPQRDRDLSCG